MSLEFKVDENVLKKTGKIYFIPALLVIAFLFLVFSTGSRIYTNLSRIITETKEIERDIELLETKISSLRTIDKQINSESVDVLSVTFPHEDPSLFAYSGIKSLAAKHSVILVDLSFSLGSPYKNGILISGLSFNVRGRREDITQFIAEITNTAPISGLGSISFSKYPTRGEDFEIAMSIDNYFSPLPESLPNRQNVIMPLTEEERRVSEEISQLQVLSKVVSSPTAIGNADINPFIGASATESGTRQ